jgi:hypothetical protein
MNLTLKREIILHILKTFGAFDDRQRIRLGITESLILDTFIIGKKIAYEREDGTKSNGNIWASCVKPGNATIKVLVADITDDDEKEVAAIIQMDEHAPYAIRLSMTNDDFGSLCVNTNDAWTDAGVSIQGKLLVGVESLTEVMSPWQKLDNYDQMYQWLIGFLNHEEE